MSQLLELQAVAVVLAGALATIAIWSPRRALIKTAAVVVSIGFMPVAYAGMADLLSKPKPIRLEWYNANAEEALVLAAQLREKEGVYLWLQLEGSPEPRYYKLPWDEELAKELQKAMQDAEKNKSGLAMKLPFEDSLDTDGPRFYPLPQPKMPDKGGAPVDQPMQYRHPGMDA
ncbi:hypothetical protein [Azospirillum halopraeferens]|uniref:hypothetical protein n=1 Tax=Azospirillum halopraeferens TaxID=34010 RepID=UPI0003FABD33|nr:hypothetical protein [Azospirillum halopraeferens]